MDDRIPLQGAPQAEAVRRRSAQRGTLLDAADPTYATFYLWHEPEAARAFLEGQLLASLSQAFGRSVEMRYHPRGKAGA